MRVLVKEKLSPHKSKTPEGYLICRDAILARTGTQEYYASEIYPNWADEDKKITILRKPEQVFSDQTLASFENKPVTVEHPDEDVTTENIKEYSVGFARDIRRGKVDGEDVMLGNLIITDEDTIRDIENGIRTELSCGYNCDITDGDEPEQINIRGNHIALCEKGRAGCAKIVDSIKDVKPRKGEKEKEFVERFMSETKEEYPDQKQRYAVAKSYWRNRDSDPEEFSKYEWFKSRVEHNFYRTPEELFNAGDYLYNKGLIDNDEYAEIIKIYEKKNGVKLTDANRLPKSIKNFLIKIFSKLSTFTHEDLDATDVIVKIQNALESIGHDEFKFNREKIEGWYKTGDGTYRKDYFFSVDGYDDEFVLSLYADDDFKTTEVNMYFTDCVDKVVKDSFVEKIDTIEYRGYDIDQYSDKTAIVELERGEQKFNTVEEAKNYIDEFIKTYQNMLRDRKIKRKTISVTHDAQYSPVFKKELAKEVIKAKNDLLNSEDVEEDDRRVEYRRVKNKTLEELRKILRNAQK